MGVYKPKKEDLEELVEEILGYLWLYNIEAQGITAENEFDYFFIDANLLSDIKSLQHIRVDISDFNWQSLDALYLECYTHNTAKKIKTYYFDKGKDD